MEEAHGEFLYSDIMDTVIHTPLKNRQLSHSWSDPLLGIDCKTWIKFPEILTMLRSDLGLLSSFGLSVFGFLQY